jgi:hypothetical protein
MDGTTASATSEARDFGRRASAPDRDEGAGRPPRPENSALNFGHQLDGQAPAMCGSGCHEVDECAVCCPHSALGDDHIRSSSSLQPGARATRCPAPSRTTRSAPIASAVVSDTFSRARSCAPDTNLGPRCRGSGGRRGRPVPRESLDHEEPGVLFHVGRQRVGQGHRTDAHNDQEVSEERSRVHR